MGCGLKLASSERILLALARESNQFYTVTSLQTYEVGGGGAFDSRDNSVSITPYPQYFPGKSTQQKPKLPQPWGLNCFSWVSSPKNTNDTYLILWTVHMENKKIENVQENFITGDFFELEG